jgi:hypothetical protein
MAASEITLPPDATSGRVAREFVGAHLDVGTEERDNATLLTSELVTNAFFHAGGPVAVAVRRVDDRLRVEVSDTSPAAPSTKGYAADAVTGRGLQLVDALSSAWGWHPASPGKVVWFELALAPVDGPGGRHREPVASDHEPYVDGLPVTLLSAPVQPMLRSAAEHDALYRELRLMSERDDERMHRTPRRLLRFIDSLNTQFDGFGRSVAQVWEDAVGRELDTVDLSFRMPAHGAAVVVRFGGLLDETDRYCREVEMLTTAPSRESVELRRWVFGEMVRQCEGELPRPWRTG